MQALSNDVLGADQVNLLFRCREATKEGDWG